MPLVDFVQMGEAVDYTPGAEVAGGEVVVQNDLVGVTKRLIPANQQGAVHVAGVFDFPKATGVGTAIGAGKKVYWDAAAKQATENTAAGANKFLGKTIAAAADADALVRVRLSQ